MIIAEKLSKNYGNVVVLDLPFLDIKSGQTIGLVGNNGAGKTTFISLLLDLIQPTTGHAKIAGILVSASEAWKPKVGAFIDESFLIGYLTPEEYFYFIGTLRGISQQEIDLFLQDFTTLFNGEILNSGKYIRDLSKGNQKKVGIVGALIGHPELVILDEPFANLDPSTQIKLKNLIKNKTENNHQTFLISSHDLAHTTEICDRIVVLEKGKLVRDIITHPDTLKELENYFASQAENSGYSNPETES